MWMAAVAGEVMAIEGSSRFLGLSSSVVTLSLEDAGPLVKLERNC